MKTLLTRRGWRRLGAVIGVLLIALLVSGCRARLYQSPFFWVWQKAQSLRYRYFPPRQDRCMASLSRVSKDFSGEIDSQLTKQNAALSDVDWPLLLTAAAREAGLKRPGVEIDAVEADTGAVLLAVDWCYGLAGVDFYVVEPAGDVVFVFESGPGWDIWYPDIYQVGDTWAVVHDVGSGQHIMHLFFIGERDGAWQVTFDSNNPCPGCDPLLWSGVPAPEFAFEDGYQRLMVTYPDTGKVLLYTWQDGRYVELP